MKITVKCFATLMEYQPQPPELETPDNFSAGDVLAQLGLQMGDGKNQVRLLLVNGVHAKPDKRLADGDRLGLFPAVGGG